MVLFWSYPEQPKAEKVPLMHMAMNKLLAIDTGPMGSVH